MDEAQNIVCYEYRDTLKTPARTEFIPLIVNSKGVKRLEPLWRRRSRTGAHGEDCFTNRYLQKVDVIVHVQISNSGRHYCGIETKRELNREELKKVVEWLARHEHICDELAEKLMDLGLEEEEIVRLVRT